MLNTSAFISSFNKFS